MPSCTNRALNRSRITSALTCPLGPFDGVDGVGPGTGEGAADGLCRSSAMTEANVGGAMIVAADDLGDSGDEGRDAVAAAD